MTSLPSIAPLIDINMGHQYRSASREAICLSIAVALHALVFLWNPTMLRGALEKPQNQLVEIGIVDEPGMAPTPEKPQKLSLMDTLKDMLTKPEPAASHTDAPKPMQTPLLQDRSMPRPIMNVMHPRTAEELATANTPAPISTTKNFKLPDAAPSLQSRAFSGVRPKDLPFETSNESIATAGQAVPIAVGNNSSKAALTYVNPALRDNSRTTLQAKKFFGSTSSEPNGINSAAAPIQLAGNAPSMAPTNAAPALKDTRSSGGGFVNRALLGGHTATTALQTLPNAHAQTDQLQDASAGASSMKKPKNGFEIEGKLANRPILKKVIPQYPSWAEEQGIIGTLRLYFTVTPEGTIRANIKVTKTTGNPQLDQVGIDALKQWVFSPQPSSSDDDVQWGIITFTFSLGS